MAKPLKQCKSYTQQLQLLESRGMIVTDNAKALNYLERVGYYRLSGYWYPFRQIDVQASKAQNKPIRKNEFVQQSNFENIVDLYIFALYTTNFTEPLSYQDSAFLKLPKFP